MYTYALKPPHSFTHHSHTHHTSRTRSTLCTKSDTADSHTHTCTHCTAYVYVTDCALIYRTQTCTLTHPKPTQKVHGICFNTQKTMHKACIIYARNLTHTNTERERMNECTKKNVSKTHNIYQPMREHILISLLQPPQRCQCAMVLQ